MIDDLKVMWPHHQSNLRDVEAYCFFPHNLTNVNSAKLSGHDESGSRGTLVHLEKSMRECHRRVFTAVEQVDGPSGPDMKELQQRSWGVPHVLPMMRKEVTDLAYAFQWCPYPVILQPCCVPVQFHLHQTEAHSSAFEFVHGSALLRVHHTLHKACYLICATFRCWEVRLSCSAVSQIRRRHSSPMSCKPSEAVLPLLMAH